MMITMYQDDDDKDDVDDDDKDDDKDAFVSATALQQLSSGVGGSCIRCQSFVSKEYRRKRRSRLVFPRASDVSNQLKLS